MPSETSRTSLKWELLNAGVNYMPATQLIDLIEAAAGEIKASPAAHHVGAHELCKMLTNAVGMLDAGALASGIGNATSDALLSAGVPRPIVVIISRLVAKAVDLSWNNLLPVQQIRVTLLLLAAAVCPDPDRCSAEDEWKVRALREVLNETRTDS